jgi:hypothetical protein
LPESSEPDIELEISSPSRCRVLIDGQDIPDFIYFQWNFTKRSETQMYLLFADQSEDFTITGFVVDSIDPQARTYRRVAMFNLRHMGCADWTIELKTVGTHLCDKITPAGNKGSDKKRIEDQIICII